MRLVLEDHCIETAARRARDRVAAWLLTAADDRRYFGEGVGWHAGWILAPIVLVVAIAVTGGLVLATYRDWRATVCCCVPLGVATVSGYWFMKELEIGLKVATMPVMVLAVVGVLYTAVIVARLVGMYAANRVEQEISPE